MKTYSTKPSDLKPVWHVIDASGKTLGRLATEVATLLMGKHKPIYSPHLNCGDFVIVINAAKVRVTGNKAEQKRQCRKAKQGRRDVLCAHAICELVSGLIVEGMQSMTEQFSSNCKLSVMCHNCTYAPC